MENLDFIQQTYLTVGRLIIAQVRFCRYHPFTFYLYKISSEGQAISHSNSKEKILLAACRIAQSRGYGGLSFRDLAEDVGIRAASIYHHFPSKEDLAAAVAKRYWQDASALLETIFASSTPIESLRQYPNVFRRSLENDNRLCLCSFMAAEHDDLPAAVADEIQIFADVNIAWLSKVLLAGSIVSAADCQARARAIFAGIAGAQLMARSRADILLFDSIVAAYRQSGLLPE